MLRKFRARSDQRRINHQLIIAAGYFIALLIVTIVLYLNLEVLNRYVLFFIKLGATLFLISLFFTIKKFIDLLRRIRNIHNQASTEIKYITLGLILVILLVAFIYQSKLVKKSEEKIDSMKFSEMNPIQINKEAISNMFQSSQTSSAENQAKVLCRNKIIDNLEVQKIKSAIDFSYSVLEVKEFETMPGAEQYRKKYTTFDLSDPLCKNQNPTKIIAVMYQLRYSGIESEMIVKTQIDKETIVVLCDENGEYLKRGYSC